MVNGKEKRVNEEIYNESFDCIIQLVDKICLCRYLRCQYLIYDNGSQFKLHFETLRFSYWIKRKPTTIMTPQANTICKRIHQDLVSMMCTSEINMAESVDL
jgi:hypothetical protein